MISIVCHVISQLFRMGQAYNEDYIRLGQQNGFSNKLFSAWDHHITNNVVAKSKHVLMKRHFEVGLRYSNGYNSNLLI